MEGSSATTVCFSCDQRDITIVSIRTGVAKRSHADVVAEVEHNHERTDGVGGVQVIGKEAEDANNAENRTHKGLSGDVNGAAAVAVQDYISLREGKDLHPQEVMVPMMYIELRARFMSKAAASLMPACWRNEVA